MNKKIFYIIAIILIIILIAAIAYLFYAKKLSLTNLHPQQLGNLIMNKNQPAKEVKKISFNGNEQQPIEKKIATATPAEMTKDEVARAATSFAERFGTYSNQANYRNITEAKIFMTARMQTWADSYLTQLRAASSTANIYYGITTRAVAKEIKDFDPAGGSAEILVHTRRQEANGSMNNIGKTFSQDITIKLIKSANTWLIDSAVWEK
jgi:hypothetical protein